MVSISFAWEKRVIPLSVADAHKARLARPCHYPESFMDISTLLEQIFTLKDMASSQSGVTGQREDVFDVSGRHEQ
jgi:hypothetical protein